jgi:hypothetical protein
VFRWKTATFSESLSLLPLLLPLLPLFTLLHQGLVGWMRIAGVCVCVHNGEWKCSGGENGNVDCKNYTKIIPLSWVWCCLFISLRGYLSREKKCAEENIWNAYCVFSPPLTLFLQKERKNSLNKTHTCIFHHFRSRFYIRRVCSHNNARGKKTFTYHETSGNNKMCLVQKSQTKKWHIWGFLALFR